MIDGLIAGKVYGQPQSRNDANGKLYAFGKVRAATASGDSLFVSVNLFVDVAELSLRHSPEDMLLFQ